MKRIKLVIEYDGTNYHGFQVQNNAHTVQAELGQAILKLTGERVSVISAGRTDAGVHALGQVVVFSTSSTIPVDKWKPALNSVLPRDIRVLQSSTVDENFHPRFSAIKKTYRYIIYRQEEGAVFYRNYAWINAEKLNIEEMRKAAHFILGRHDFRSFCSSGSAVKNFERTVTRLDIEEKKPFLILEIEADGFLYNMVRIIVGTLVEVGKGTYSSEYVKEIIESKDRNKAGATAPPQGLYLVKVEYL
ncbi:tRNA pseudouridine(38-40) synthase TruA [Thermosyntropha sp.]|uniref:tRNA pseudouridine(38-40) synthase TruA n=1 Tax=Thermosyntropha sp. TaxID=2740820 RepID=UPI0025F731B6|nr:tRNA pseudouridine(38-40) synthase TruA [Thermosyntropha sp.]MBO8158073.1 tRNA pseudouridine(38-40) synthase TruA [Thermosyntropha sp.]